MAISSDLVDSCRGNALSGDSTTSIVLWRGQLLVIFWLYRRVSRRVGGCVGHLAYATLRVVVLYPNLANSSHRLSRNKSLRRTTGKYKLADHRSFEGLWDSVSGDEGVRSPP